MKRRILFMVLMVGCTITQAYYLEHARDAYHNTPQYKKWQQFKQQNEITLKQIDKKIF